MEYLDAFDINGNHVGKIERNKAHGENPGVYHKAVWIWFINNAGGGAGACSEALKI